MKRSLRARKRDKDKAEDAESFDDKGVTHDTHDLADNDATEEDGLLVTVTPFTITAIHNVIYTCSIESSG